jgi:methylmalonyl-CoA mutase
VPELVRDLEALGRADILVVAGGVIPPRDHEALYQAGVVGIFGPGTPITRSAGEVMDVLLEGLKGRVQ